MQGAPAVELVLVGAGATVIAARDGKEEQAPVLLVDAFAEPQRCECAVWRNSNRVESYFL